MTNIHIRIHKYRLDFDHTTFVPTGDIIHVDMAPADAGDSTAPPSIWVTVNAWDAAEPPTQNVVVIPTGATPPLGYRHAGSVVHHQFVWHVYACSMTSAN